MNIKILKSSQNFKGIMLKENKVMEIKYHKSQFQDINSVKYYLLDLETNNREEILPKIKKFSIMNIEESYMNSDYILFSSIVQSEKNNTEIQLYKYYYLDNEYEKIYSVYDDIELYPHKKKIRIFPLNDNYILLQYENLKATSINKEKGFFGFEQKLINTKEKTEQEIFDKNLKNNGVEKILPISNTHSIIKTGYSLFKDDLYKKISEEEACVESISIINTQQLISDIFLLGDDLLQEVIAHAHYSTSFTPIKVIEDYLIYSSINFTTREEIINFYNFQNKESTNCRNQNVNITEDIAKSYVIDNMPYIKLNTERGSEFFNIKRGKVDIIFDKNVTVEEYINNIFIVSKTINKTFKRNKNILSIYKYPGMTLLHEEKGEYSGCINEDNENINVFVK